MCGSTDEISLEHKFRAKGILLEILKGLRARNFQAESVLGSLCIGITTAFGTAFLRWYLFHRTGNGNGHGNCFTGFEFVSQDLIFSQDLNLFYRT